MFLLFGRRKLKFKFRGEHVVNGISLAEAFAGRSGIVYLGQENIELWTPTGGPLTRSEAVCDCRFIPLQPSVCEHFEKATSHLLLPAKIVVFHGSNKAKIDEALTMFDYVLTPMARIRNTPQDIMTRKVLAYEKPLYTRRRYDINKDYN